MKHDFSYFKNTDCRYFPCHKTEDDDYFNCLFCYCPLYALGDKCGGNFKYTAAGIKNCSDCIKPHARGGYENINKNFGRIAELAKKKRPAAEDP